MYNRRQSSRLRAPPTYYRIGHYILKETIGSGSFGKVKIADDEKTGARYACKIIDKDSVKEATRSIQVQKEIDCMRRLRHKNTVALVRVITTSTKIYIFMEYVVGGELFTEIQRCKGFPEPEARFYFRQLIEGVQYCHNHGVYHRDLKPENLLLDANGTLKITDFGLSTLKNHRSTGSLLGSRPLKSQCGTPNYAAPEIVTLGKGCDGYSGERVDAWSCGCILYVLVAGDLPFDSTNVDNVFKLIMRADPKFPSYFSEDLIDLIQKLLTIEPSQRYTLSDVRAHRWFNGPVEEHVPFIPPWRLPHVATNSEALNTTQHPQFTQHQDANMHNSHPTHLSQPNGADPHQNKHLDQHAHPSHPARTLQNAHVPIADLLEATNLHQDSLAAAAGQAAGRNAQPSLDSLDRNIAADYLGREVELNDDHDDHDDHDEHDDNDTYMDSDEDEGYGDSSCGGTSMYTYTDADASDSMYSNGYAAYSDGTDYHAVDNFSESGPGTRTSGHSSYDRQDHDQDTDRGMSEQEHDYQVLPPAHNPSAVDVLVNNYHDTDHTLRPDPNTLQLSHHGESKNTPSNHVRNAVVDDRSSPVVPPLLSPTTTRQPDIPTDHSGTIPVPHNIDQNVRNKTPGAIPNHVPHHPCRNGIFDLSYETSTTDSTCVLPLTGERASKHPISSDFEHTAATADYDSIGSTTIDYHRPAENSQIHTTPPSSEYEPEEARNLPGLEPYFQTLISETHPVSSRRRVGVRRVHSLDNVSKNGRNHMSVDYLSTSGVGFATNPIHRTIPRKAEHDSVAGDSARPQLLTKSHHIGDLPDNVSGAEKVQTLAKDVQRLNGSTKNETQSSGLNGCICIIDSRAEACHTERQISHRTPTLQQSCTDDDRLPAREPHRESWNHIPEVNAAPTQRKRDIGVAKIEDQFCSESENENTRDVARGKVTRAARRNGPKQLRFNIAGSKRESDWVRTEADRRLWCQFMKDFELVPDYEEFGVDSATLSELWQSGLASENLSTTRFSEYMFHANSNVRPRSAQYLSSPKGKGKHAGTLNDTAAASRKVKSRRSKRVAGSKSILAEQDNNVDTSVSQGAGSDNIGLNNRVVAEIPNSHLSSNVIFGSDDPNRALPPANVASCLRARGYNRLIGDGSTETKNRPRRTTGQRLAVSSPLSHRDAEMAAISEDDLLSSDARGSGPNGVHFDKAGLSTHTVPLHDVNSNERSRSAPHEAAAVAVVHPISYNAVDTRLESGETLLSHCLHGNQIMDAKTAPSIDHRGSEYLERKDVTVANGRDEDGYRSAYEVSQEEGVGNGFTSSRDMPVDNVISDEDTKSKLLSKNRATMSTSDSNRTTSSRQDHGISSAPGERSMVTPTSGGDGNGEGNDTNVSTGENDSERFVEQEQELFEKLGYIHIPEGKTSDHMRLNDGAKATNPFELNIPSPKGVPPPPNYTPRPMSIFLSRIVSWKETIPTKATMPTFGRQASEFEALLKPNQSCTLVETVLELCGCEITLVSKSKSTNKHQIKCCWQGPKAMVFAKVRISVLATNALSTISVSRFGAYTPSNAAEFKTFCTMLRKTFFEKVQKIGNHDAGQVFNNGGKLTEFGRKLLYQEESSESDCNIANSTQ